jgi:hypothetical protein
MSEEMIPVSWIDDQVIVHRKRANDSNIQYRKKVENLKANTIEDLIAKWKGIKEDKKPFQIGTQIIANTDPSMVRICTSIDAKVPPPIIGTIPENLHRRNPVLCSDHRFRSVPEIPSLLLFECSHLS